ncbi:uncharacterized protein [Gossypium hirsutum]|uniref:Reverse transcriptase n=1 Tax=Gossypium hirsutum TaxID=3635 RepID=A0A1U8K1Q1_GOSHI|nr:uncharacterized protein LOC107911117 [Gossypium hirsutum]
MVANRFQKVLEDCIDSSQSAFLPGRLISNNVLPAYEILHTFGQKRNGKKGLMTLKLDMSKAYDRVEWGFVCAMMEKMGFHRAWVDIVLKCISSISYSDSIN